MQGRIIRETFTIYWINMPFAPGYHPNAGRPKGSKNKLKRVAAVFESIGFDPCAEAIEMYRKFKDKDPMVAFKALMQIWEYTYAKPKDIVDTSETPEESVVNADKLMKELEEASKPIIPTENTPTQNQSSFTIKPNDA